MPDATTSVTITAGNVVTTVTPVILPITASAADYTINGELDLVNSSITNVRAVKSAGTLSLDHSTFSATGSENSTLAVKVGAGSNFTVSSLATNSTMTIAAGGTVNITGTSNPLTGAIITINGGTLNTTSVTGGPTVTLNGGTIVDTSIDTGAGRPITTWNSGTLVDNGGQWDSSNAGTLFTRLASTASNVLQLSNSGKRTFAATTNSGTYSLTGGKVQFNVYSNTANDNDKFGHAAGVTGTDYRMTSGVHLVLAGNNLTGTASSYLGVVYTLVDDETAGTTNMAPTIDAPQWTINGLLYNVGLSGSIDSATGSYSVKVTSVELAPEPGTLSLALLGLGGVSLRRRSRRLSLGPGGSIA